MFSVPLEEIVTVKNLKHAYARISKKATGLDKVSAELFEENLDEMLQSIVEDILKGAYVPEPLSRIYIPKTHGIQQRPIGIGAIKDKVVQKCLALALGGYFEKEFSDKSYGYRPGKGTLRAIGRVKDFLRRGGVYVYRLDIDNFFETVSHTQLLSLLEQRIDDRRIVELIALFLKNGSFHRFRYIEHLEGIHQGDPLSPLLANIYLNQLDWFWENNGIDFVRFADDSVLFFKNEKARRRAIALTSEMLVSLALHADPSKSGTFHAVKEGFEFLGIRFKGDEVYVGKQAMDSIIANIHHIAKSTQPFSEATAKLQTYLTGLMRYYLQLLDASHPQYKLILDALILALSKRITIERKRGTITTKKAFRELLLQIDFPYIKSKTQRKDLIERIVNKGIDTYLESKRYRKSETKIVRKKRRYDKRYATSSVLYVEEAGTFVGVSKHTITLKQRGKVVFKMGKKQCERIIVASPSVGLSGALVKLCATEGIAIDFIDATLRATPYASLVGTKQAYAKMSLKQLRILGTPLQLTLAKAFVKGKLKNQINYLKYLNKYHKHLDAAIEGMQKQLVKMQALARSSDEIMGFEGVAATHYWGALADVLDDKVDFPGRVAYGAKDVVNAALNYGYGILYSRVQYHLVRAGLSLHISFLHALDDAKPTLVFDVIEEFRAFVVDRAVISMFNQKEPIKLEKDGKLDMQSRRLIAKNVLEKLGAYTRHKRASKKVDTIISEQAYMLARAVRGETTYRPFIGKY